MVIWIRALINKNGKKYTSRNISDMELLRFGMDCNKKLRQRNKSIIILQGFGLSKWTNHNVTFPIFCHYCFLIASFYSTSVDFPAKLRDPIKGWHIISPCVPVSSRVLSCSIFYRLQVSIKRSKLPTGKKKRNYPLEKVSFHSNPKERQCQRMLRLPHNCTHLTCQ